MMLLNLNKVIIERRGVRQNVRGILVEPKKEDFKFTCTIQPEKNITLIREVFGSHVEAAIKVYSNLPLRTKGEDGSADVIVYQGKRWEVSEVRNYTDILPHWKMIAILIKDER
jgi:hypothetical protein